VEEKLLGGGASQIQTRVWEMRKQKEVETSESTGTSLVLADYYKIEIELNMAFLKDQGIELRRAKSSRSSSVLGSAMREGKEYGSKLPLGASVEGTKIAGLLG